ncbi:protein-L-isoaspartate(D-aspartate) O-methyltransferase [Okibacterium endophyticum]
MDDRFLRERMVAEQVEARGVTDRAVTDAMRRVPRHEFVSGAEESAYEDHPVQIGDGQTISQPYIVAVMAEAMSIGPGDNVLEVGAGSGYAAAVFAEMGAAVTTIERHSGLADGARNVLSRLGYHTVTVITGDGSDGWPDSAPYDAISVAAATEEVPPAWPRQLRTGGRLVVPLGTPGFGQQLRVGVKSESGELVWQDLGGVTFVPLVR